MIGPRLGSRIEQPLDLAGRRVDPCQIRALKQIAPLTGHAKVRQVDIGAAALSGHDVLEMVGKFDVVLVNMGSTRIGPRHGLEPMPYVARSIRRPVGEAGTAGDLAGQLAGLAGLARELHACDGPGSPGGARVEALWQEAIRVLTGFARDASRRPPARSGSGPSGASGTTERL